MEYVWYAAYGSNLLRERFMCYIKGGRFRLGGSTAPGCADSEDPVSDEPFVIRHPVYFAGRSASWGNSGVAFLDVSGKNEPGAMTYGRIWKVTAGQFECIHSQEGDMYGREVFLGNHSDGCRILTFTSTHGIKESKPSPEYVRTIADGLREIHSLGDDEIAAYLNTLPGINGNYSANGLLKLCRQRDSMFLEK